MQLLFLSRKKIVAGKQKFPYVLKYKNKLLVQLLNLKKKLIFLKTRFIRHYATFLLQALKK